MASENVWRSYSHEECLSRAPRPAHDAGAFADGMGADAGGAGDSRPAAAPESRRTASRKLLCYHLRLID